MLEFKTYRHHGHFEGDPGTYRPKDELEAWIRKDPIGRYEKYLLDTGLVEQSELEGIQGKVDVQIQQALDFALASEEPSIELALQDIYSDIVEEGRNR